MTAYWKINVYHMLTACNPPCEAEAVQLILKRLDNCTDLCLIDHIHYPTRSSIRINIGSLSICHCESQKTDAAKSQN